MNKIKYIILLFILLLLIIPTIVAVDDSIKADSTIIVNASNITVGDIEKITVHVNEDATGVINITVEGKNYSAPKSLPLFARQASKNNIPVARPHFQCGVSYPFKTV